MTADLDAAGARLDPVDQRARGNMVRHAMWGDGHAERLAMVRRMEPGLADLVLREGFGGIYADERLSLQQRSLCTIASLATQGRHRQLESHLEAALRLGISPASLSAAIVHLFLYVGLPTVLEALGILDKVVKANQPHAPEGASSTDLGGDEI